LVCLTGVSGSGKSTLMRDVLHKALAKIKRKPAETPGRHRAIRGHEHIEEVVLVDQSPIGRTARSNPASYVGAFDAIRRMFAAEPLARERGYTAGTFSFNSGNGRCPTCTGSGFEHVEMQFLSDVYLRCPDCDGRRFRPEVLEVKLSPTTGASRARSISDVLDMTVAEANAFFAGQAEVVNALTPLQDVGLDYLKLGQPVPTLSGGEAQRLKLARRLTDARARRAAADNILFLLDEPTTGLHFNDIAILLRALRALIARGHSVLVIEHNLDLIRSADWIVDLGPEGGDAGGELVCCGTPEEVARHARSYTGAALRQYKETFPTIAPSPPARETTAWMQEVEKRREQFPRAGVRGSARALVAASPSLLPEGAGTLTPTPLPLAGEGSSLRSEPFARRATHFPGAIRIHQAREHNLQGVDVTIPHGRFTVVTGISGSGKSTLAFDILFAEGQRRYLESLNAYARQFVQPAARPDVDAIFGIPPTVAIEQRTSRGGRKSTVATMTEIYHFLRLLFVKLGRQHCPECQLPIEPQTPDSIIARIMRDYRKRRITLLAPLVSGRKGYYTDLAKWALAKGFGQLRVDGAWTPTAQWPRLSRFREHQIELPIGTVTITPKAEAELRSMLERALDYGKGVVRIIPSPHSSPASGRGRVRAARKNNNSLSPSGGDDCMDAGGTTPWMEEVEPRLEQRPRETQGAVSEGKGEGAVFSIKRACPGCGRSFPELDPRLFSFNSKHGWCERCYGTGMALSGFDDDQTGEEIWWNEWWEGAERICPDCEGRRLRPEALAVRFHNRPITKITALPITAVARWFDTLKLRGRAAEIASGVLPELKARLKFLIEVGLGYLTLDRAAPSLSGGEAQRIRLAAQLGSNLRGVCYILDEPTIGLHARDNRMLLATLKRLRAKGNTVVVVEHDEETIAAAEHLVDLGPGAGANGGRVVAQGSLAEIARSAESVTGRFLAQPLRHPLVARRPSDGRAAARLEVAGARRHNLKNLRVSIPMGRLVCVTGVSGSGKSTLVREILFENLQRLLRRSRRGKIELQGCDTLTGWEPIGRALEVDQTPIGKTPRSCPATYVGFWDAVRKLFAAVPEARLRGFTTSRFSFNVSGGRCVTCEGQGMKRIEMSFLPDVTVACEDCNGARFTPETLSVRYRDRSIADVLAMSVDEAVEFFAAHSAIHHALRLLQDVGLGYLRLGQQSPTLSGGEAQRIKLVTELAKTRPAAPGPPGSPRTRNKRARDHTLYVLDEPTIGLHMADVEKLIRVLHRLVDAGNTVVIIEHNLDVVSEADWIVDLGPEGGLRGGRVVAQGPPEQVARRARGSHTAKYLQEFLRTRRAADTPTGLEPVRRAARN
jgi:excinuclease ABC subunit A